MTLRIIESILTMAEIVALAAFVTLIALIAH
jgi:hypothetical protein